MDVSFGDQLAELQPWLLGVALNLTRRRDEAEDLVQDVNVRALRFRHRFDGRNLKGWLRVIAGNVLVDAGRHRAVIQFEPLELHPSLRGGDVEEQAIATLALRQIFTGADPVLRMSLTMSAAEIAQLLSRSENRVHRRLRDARNRARRRVV